ncbi:diacylglycerol/lipid kinase family protein [Arthrobacter castelli]|uniref:diacylglycerol/lipid kinase family protein n=1 Tax=Arthrobacter castelli TaxID=271431 RepID=UPI00047A3740|nr:diacylglycerol kinase family protein [Arthrobacter castelli]
MSENLLVVVNASAGTAHQRGVDAAMAVMRAAAEQNGNSVELAATRDLAHLEQALDQLKGRRLVLMGGDGSIHAAVQCLHQRGQLYDAGPVGLIPLGTGNDLAGSLGIPLNPAQAAKTVMTGQTRPMELFVSDDGNIAVNAVHVGIGASAAARGASVKRRLGKIKLGKLGYPLGAIAAGFNERGWRLTVKVDGQLIHDDSTPVLMAAMGLGGTVGGGARLIPDANPHDGCVDVVVWESVGSVARTAYALGLKSGNHASRKDVRTGSGQSVEIQAADDDTFMASNDGELRGRFNYRRWTIENHAWQVIVPPSELP